MKAKKRKKSVKSGQGILVYGVGAHLADVLRWQPNLAEHIERVFDKDANKIGEVYESLGIKIESAKAIADLPKGTEIAVAAIRYLEEIQREIRVINPGVSCRHIDEVIGDLNQGMKKHWQEFRRRQVPDDALQGEYGIYLRLYDFVRRKMRGLGQDMPVSRGAFLAEVEAEEMGLSQMSDRECEAFISCDFAEVVQMRLLKRFPNEGELEAFMNSMVEEGPAYKENYLRMTAKQSSGMR